MPDPSMQAGGYNYNSGPPSNQQIPPLNTNNNFIRTGDYPPQGPQSAVRPGTAQPNVGRPGTAGSLAPGQGPIRPSSATGYGPPPHRHPLSQGQRANEPLAIAPGPSGPIVPAGTYPVGPQGPPRGGSAMGPGGVRQPSGGRGPQYPGPGIQSPINPEGQFNRHPQHRPPPVDIGFEAPGPRPPNSPGPRPPRSPGPQQMGAPQQRPDRRPSPGPGQGPLSPVMGGLPTSPSPLGGGYQPPHSPGFPAPQHMQQQGPPHSPGFPPPQHMQQQPPPQSPGFPPQQQQHMESPMPSPPLPPSQSTTPKPHSQAAPPKPMGKGPKTFEEMGVPAQQKEQDCVCLSRPALPPSP